MSCSTGRQAHQAWTAASRPRPVKEPPSGSQASRDTASKETQVRTFPSAAPGFLIFRNWLFLRRLHLPRHSREVEGRHPLGLLVFGGGHVRCLHCLHHRIHQVLCSLDQGHGAVHLRGTDGRGRKERRIKILFPTEAKGKRPAHSGLLAVTNCAQWSCNAHRGADMQPSTSARKLWVPSQHVLPTLTDETYPRDNQLPTKVLHLGLDFAADVELVAVEGDALKVGQQVLLAG